jgi:hypothetical protein
MLAQTGAVGCARSFSAAVAPSPIARRFDLSVLRWVLVGSKRALAVFVNASLESQAAGTGDRKHQRHYSTAKPTIEPDCCYSETRCRSDSFNKIVLRIPLARYTQTLRLKHTAKEASL